MSGGDVGGSNRIGATGTATLLGQSTSFLDAIATQISQHLPEMAMLILYQLVRHGDLIQLDGMSESDRILLQDVYSMNVEDIPGLFKFRARLSSVQDSKMAKQQAAMGLYQIYKDYTQTAGQYAMQLTQLAQMAQSGQGDFSKMQEIMMSGLVGLNKLMEDMLKNYDEDNVEDFLFFSKDMQMVLQVQDAQRNAEVEQVETRISGQQSAATSEPLPTEPSLEGAGGAGSPTGAEPSGVQSPDVAAGAGATVGGPEV